MRTRLEHLDWCKQRAVEEMNFYNDPSKAYISMASDLRKHPETNSEALISLCVMQPMMGKNTRADVLKFLDGFH